jgi:hypothetical protein
MPVYYEDLLISVRGAAMLYPGCTIFALPWRRESLVKIATRALILWSLATIVVCGMIKHTYAHRLSSDHLTVLSRILRAASMHSMRSRARNQDNDEAITATAQSLAWRCRMAILSASGVCEEAADKLCTTVIKVKTAVARLLVHVPTFRKLTPLPGLCPLLTTRLRC